MYVETQRTGPTLDLSLRGQWSVRELAAIEPELAGLDLSGVQRLRIGTTEAQFDLSGAWLLSDFLARLDQQHLAYQFSGAPPAPLTLIARTIGKQAPEDAPEDPHHAQERDPAEAVEAAMEEAVEGLGRRAVRGWLNLTGGLDFIGHVIVLGAKGLRRPQHLRPVSIARHVYDTGLSAIPVVTLIAFLISVILAYMGAQELRKFGADIFVVDLVTIGMLRELGVLLTAIIIAGRSGSAFAAEIGAMRLNEEVDALEAIGVDPVEVLVLPRLIGLVIAMPLLTILADAIGIVGGGLLCHTLLDMSLLQYVERVKEAISPTTFWVGMIKAPVFGVLIAVAGCHCGLRVRGSSRELGRLTTVAVVQAIFLVILADALFAVLFMELRV